MSTPAVGATSSLPSCMSQSDGASQPLAIGENPDLTLTGNRSDPRHNVSAPSATRTRDLLLRRQLLYPLSYRGQPGAAAASRHSTGAI